MLSRILAANSPIPRLDYDYGSQDALYVLASNVGTPLITPFPPASNPPPPKRRTGFRRVLLVLFMTFAMLLVADRTTVTEEIRDRSPRLNDAAAWISAGWDVGLARIGETPHLDPSPPSGTLPLCEGTPDYQVAIYTEAFGLMRSTVEGQRLYEMLLEEGVCIRTDDLAYNSAYSLIRWDSATGWSNTEIVVDHDFVTSLYPDLLAAVLIHEATHVDRAVRQISCFVVNACTLLDNGVSVEEEVAAHSAEAEFWIALYGEDGKSRAVARDRSENVLKSEYLKGPEDFYAFVAEQRSDSREGEGIK